MSEEICCRNDVKGKGLLSKIGSRPQRDPFSGSRENESGNQNENKGDCRPSLLECPLVKKYQESLKKGNDRVRVRACSGKTESSRTSFSGKESRKSDRAEKSQSDRDSRSTWACSNSLGIAKSTKTQDLRNRTNRDFSKLKTPEILSPYASASACLRKKKPNSAESKCLPRRSGQEKNPSETLAAGKKAERPKGRGKPIEREDSDPSSADSRGDFKRIVLKKSRTFFICKGPKREIGGGGEGEGDEKNKEGSSPRVAESEEEIFSPRPNPITHNDSFCLIAKSSRNWNRKNRSDDEKLLRYGFGIEETKSERKEEKGILKNCARDLKSVDSLERIDSEKIVRFSDEQSGKGKVLKKNVRRKRRLENTVNAAWYRRNKLFQKYLQILKSKSVLYAPQETSPRSVKPSYPDSPFMRDRYEAEMLGLVPRQGRFLKIKKKFSIEDDDLE